MKEEEIQPAQDRIKKFYRLKDRETMLRVACDKLSRISGNASDDVPLTSLEFETCITDSKNAWTFKIEGVEITSYQFRLAILPLVQVRLAEVRKEMEEL